MRMRFLVVFVPLAVLPGRANALIPTDSIAEDIALAQSYAQALKTWILQNTQALSEANTDIQTAKIYLQDVESYIAFVQNPSLYAAQALLDSAGLTSDLPVSPQIMMQIANGFDSLRGAGGAMSLNQAFGLLNVLGSLTSTAFAANHVYTCPAADPVCVDINARAAGIAGSMGTAASVYADLQKHQTIAAGLRADLAGETTPARRETISAQLQIETVWTANLAASLKAAMAQSQLQQESFNQRAIERQRQSADALFADTQPITTPIQ